MYLFDVIVGKWQKSSVFEEYIFLRLEMGDGGGEEVGTNGWIKWLLRNVHLFISITL